MNPRRDRLVLRRSVAGTAGRASRSEGPQTRPAYLELTETAAGRFTVLWRTPVLAGMRLPAVLQLPDGVRNVREPSIQELSDSLVSGAPSIRPRRASR